MPLSDEFIKKIEIEYLRLISDLLRSGKITPETAKETAQEYLKLLPFATTDDLMAKAKSFTETFPALDKYYVLVMNEIEEVKTQAVLEKMRLHLQQNEVDKAINLVQ